MYRDPDLLKLAKGEPCLLQIHDKCLGSEGSTTVAAHSNQGIHGKGKSIKADDCYSVWACHRCHSMLDQGKINAEDAQAAWDLAFERQLEHWQSIADNPCLYPWRVDAARRVLDYLESKHGKSR